MIIENKYPICEFDTNNNAKIKASDFLEKSLPKKCVITFFRKELEELASEKGLPIIGKLHSEVVDLPIYGYSNDICIAIPFAAAPGAAVTLEELYAMGCEKFIVCGGAGCIVDDMDLGKIIIPTLAIRDEGTSYHYI